MFVPVKVLKFKFTTVFTMYMNAAKLNARQVKCTQIDKDQILNKKCVPIHCSEEGERAAKPHS